MNDNLPDDIALLKQRLAEQDARILAPEAKPDAREREVDYLQAQLDKLCHMNFGSRMQQESDARTGRVDDPPVPRPLRKTRTRRPFPESLLHNENRLKPAESCCPDFCGVLSYLCEYAVGKPELMRSAFWVICTVREKHARKRCDRIVQALAPLPPL